MFNDILTKNELKEANSKKNLKDSSINTKEKAPLLDKQNNLNKS